MPAENEPAEPNALTQSSQLTCSLMPSSTFASTRLVIIWLKRWLATSLIEPTLDSTPVGPAGGQGGSADAAGGDAIAAASGAEDAAGGAATAAGCDGRSAEFKRSRLVGSSLFGLNVDVEVGVGVEFEVEVDVDVEVEVE